MDAVCDGSWGRAAISSRREADAVTAMSWETILDRESAGAWTWFDEGEEGGHGAEGDGPCGNFLRAGDKGK